MSDAESGNSTPFLLIVDDNPAMREMLQEVFHFAGYRVGIAASADQALQILKTAGTLPKLIISDLLMPDTDGYQFMLSVRKESHWQRIPFLFISGQESTNIFEEPSPTGVLGYLSKPFAVDELLDVVSQVATHS